MTEIVSITTDRARLAPGLYVGLPEDIYHNAIPYLGSGDVRDLAKCAMYYWQHSHMNPLCEKREETPYLLFGRALHCLVLEGVEAFKSRYTRTPEPQDFKRCLVTNDDLKAALRVLGEKVGGNKDELIARLRSARAALVAKPTDGEDMIWAREAVIFDDALTAHLERCADLRLTTLKRAVYDEVIRSGGFIAGDKRVSPAFQGGIPEMSIFWERNGAPCKIRLDFTRLGRNRDGKIVALVTDLKSFANQRGLPPERAVTAAIAEYRLDMQAAHGLDGCAMIGEFIKRGMVYGAEHVSPKFLDALAALGKNDFIWHWAFYQKDAPVCLLRSAAPALVAAARRSVDAALETYAANMAAFGADWRYTDAMPDISVDLNDLPAWLANAA